MHVVQALAALTRLLLAILPGHLDLTTFEAWGRLALSYHSFGKFFAHTWVDYLPLPIYFTTLIYKISLLLHLPFSFLFKASLSIIELCLLHQITKKLNLFILLFPPLILTTALWGQFDGIIALLLLLAFKQTNSRPFLSIFLFALVILTKPITFFVLPFYLLYSQKPFSRALSLLTYTTLFAYLTTIPATHSFNPQYVFRWLVHKLIERVENYPFTSINAYNFWGAVSGFWQRDATKFLYLDFRTWGVLLFLIFWLPLLVTSYKKRTTPYKFVSLSLLLFYTFFTRIHERHLLYALVFMLPLTSTLKPLLIGYSTLYTFNLLGSLFWLKTPHIFLLRPPHSTILSILETILTLIFFLHTLRFKLNLSSLKPHLKNLLLLLSLSSLLRLPFLSYPTTMMFDEVYHAFTAKAMLHNDIKAWEWWHKAPPGFAYEWTHPPLAKYGMVLGMSIFGPNSFGWRFFSAILGVASILLLYSLSFLLTRSKQLSFLASLLLSVDGLHITQSLIATNDIYLLFFLLAALVFLFQRRWLLAGIMWGLGMASKWSALYLAAPIIYFLSTLSYPISQKIKLFVSLIFIFIFTYLLAYLPFFFTHSFNTFIELHRQMFSYHTHLNATHPYQSTPLQWIFGLRPVWYFVSHPLPTLSTNIYATSSPLTLFLGLLSFVFLVLKKPSNYLLIFLSYLSFILPWTFSPRIMFFYHYLPALPFLYLSLAFFLTTVFPRRKITYLILLLILSVSFLLLPLNLGIPMPSSYFRTLFRLLPTWK